MGRSQMAQALFERISKHQTESAGTKVGDKDSQTLEDFAKLQDWDNVNESLQHVRRFVDEPETVS